LSWGLASKGVAVLRYEKRTKQYANQLVEIKNEITVEQETIEDAIAAVTLLQSIPEIDKSKIFMLGHSLGGMLIPRIAQKSNQIAGFVIMAGTARPLEDVIYEQFAYIFSLDGQLSEDEKNKLNELEAQIKMVKSTNLSKDTSSEKLPLEVPASYWLDLRGYDPAKLAADLKKPVLILQGERDYQVTMDDYKRWKDALSEHQNVTFKLYKNLNHLFIEGEGKSTPSEYEKPGHVHETVVQDITDWIKKY
jgi:dipeptidyl aminopeptidase/acylaminoacyl peptidase